MRNLVYAFGIVAIIDFAADGDMNLIKQTGNETSKAFWNVTEGIIDGSAYVIKRIALKFDN